MWTKLRYEAVPPAFVLFFTCIVEYMAITGKSESFALSTALRYALGNAASWSWCTVAFLWAFASLKVSSKVTTGPETSYGFRPTYKDNGLGYYFVTCVIYAVVDTLFNVSEYLYDNFPYILGSFNVVALSFCLFLLVKGKVHPSHPEDIAPRHNILYEFYRGVELHPSVLGVDIKQLTNCRIGLMGWQIYVWAFFLTALRRTGFNPGLMVNVALQTVYIAKFFWWESGYFYTLDMMLDRAGYYICWGCLVWVPCLYTYSTYYAVAHPSSAPSYQAVVAFAIGLISIILNYRVDYEKEVFRRAPNRWRKVFGKEPTFIAAEWTDTQGQRRTSRLLTAGFWGIARHLNYTFELMAALAWCSAAGLDNIPAVHYYFLFLLGLLVHRTLRDDVKCREKYGRYWDAYCSRVRYILVPYIW